MSNEAMKPIGTLPKFDRLVKPLEKSELIKMKEEILESEDARIIHTWRGKHLLDRERYEMCAQLSLSATIEEHYFEDWMGAAEYICRQQLKTIQQGCKYQKYLIGQLLQYVLSRNRDQDNAEKKMVLAESVGSEWKLTGATVSKYGFFANAIDDIFGLSENLARMILSDKVAVSHENVLELSRLRGGEIRAIGKTIETENLNKITLAFIRNEVKLCHIQERGVVSRKEKQDMEISQNVGIRQMPKYDPDSGVNSLCMTIESWISSIQRVRNSEDFLKITEQASLRLMKKLSGLEYVINATQESLVERTKL